MTKENQKIITSQTFRTILFAGLLTTLMIPIVGMNTAEAAPAVDDELVEFAIQLQEVKEMQKDAEGQEKINLDKDEKDLIKVLNSQGIATDEQFKEDPTYWINLRHTIIEEKLVEPTQINNVLYTDETPITLACGCVDKLKFKAGYSVYAWGTWWQIMHLAGHMCLQEEMTIQL